MSDSVLLLEASDGVATLTLNRPSAMNALSRELRAALAAAFREVEEREDVGVVILTGAGERAFCAGLDLKELGGEGDSRGGAADEAVAAGGDVIAAMESCTRPILAAINGFAITGGFELALACDVLIAARGARFADTHARVGIMPGWGLSQKLSRLIGIHRAKELSLTGNFLDAEEAAAWGLVNRVVEPADLLDTCRALAADMLSCDQAVMRAYKRVIDAGFARSYGEGRELERQVNREHGRSLSAETIAERRAQVQARGRSQSQP